jgi:diguanylate cyclase (GGDEF)-like protein
MSTVEKIRTLIESTELPADRGASPPRTFTVSVGLSIYPDTSTGAEELLRRADQSLLQAKMAGRNTVLLWKDDPVTGGGPTVFSSTAIA